MNVVWKTYDVANACKVIELGVSFTKWSSFRESRSVVLSAIQCTKINSRVILYGAQFCCCDFLFTYLF